MSKIKMKSPFLPTMNEEQFIVQILRENQLSITVTRKQILSIFLNTDRAVSHGDIEEKLEGVIDRVTLYRNLHVFLDKFIIHTIPTDTNVVQYAMTHRTKRDENLQHVHFLCEECNKMSCLDVPIVIAKKQLSDRYVVRSMELVLRGMCEHCNDK